MQDHELLTTLEAARILRCGEANIRKLARAGKLPVKAIVGRGQRLFDRELVEQLAVDRAAARSAA